MASDNVPVRDSVFGPWLLNFAAVAAAHSTELNLSNDQTTAMQEFADSFKTACIENTAAKAHAKGKAAAKRGIRRGSEDFFRGIAKVIAADRSIDTNLKAELGIKVSPSPLGVVVPVKDLAVNGFANGRNVLTWNRNGNADGTAFLIEVCHADSGTWSLMDVTSRCRYIHDDQTPGVQIQYRIISQRANKKSGPSNVAIIYAAPSLKSVAIKLAA